MKSNSELIACGRMEWRNEHNQQEKNTKIQIGRSTAIGRNRALGWGKVARRTVVGVDVGHE
uniref:Uncharacterized protein n=1 Tax=Arundo donax TaxID=35708 RepID=A0A0A8ZT23_ARUDO